MVRAELRNFGRGGQVVGGDLKTYLLVRWKVPDALAVVRPTGFTGFFFFASVFSFIYC